MSDAAGPQSPDDPPAPSQTWAWLRVLAALPFYGTAWVLAAGLALVWFGVLAGWRDMRAFTNEGE